VREVKFTQPGPNGEPVSANAEVPKPGTSQKWAKNFPSKEQLLQAAKIALLATDPQLVEPPWQKLVRSVADKWGPPGESGWVVTAACPYVSNEISIELKWAVGKNYCAQPQQQFPNRSMAQIVRQIRHYWYDIMEEVTFHKIFRHCEDQMAKWMKYDREQNGGMLSGTLGSLEGLPSDAEYKLWRTRAGLVGDDAVTGDVEDDDMFFTGDDEQP